MTRILVIVLALAPAWSAAAGELVLKSGKHLAADLAQRSLVVSTGSDLLEIPAGDVAEVTPEAVRLADGRSVRGTLVGGQLRTRTEFGELLVSVDDLAAFRTAAAPPARPGGEPGSGPARIADGVRRIGQGAGAAATGIARTVTEGANRLHDGFKAMGVAIRDGVTGVGRAVERAFTE